MSGEKKYYLANLPAKTDLRTLAATIKARWICEQAHQQLKEELCLDHFEGRSWQGLLRHALMTMIAYAFLQHRPYSIGALAGFTIPPSRVIPSLPQTPEAIVKYRCDYCGGHLGLIVDRYYRMRFCCKAHVSAYKQRLTMETRAKIRHLELLAPT